MNQHSQLNKLRGIMSQVKHWWHTIECVSVQWHDSSVSSFSPGKAHSIVCHQCFTCDMILLNLFSWLCWVIIVSCNIVLETSQLSPWHAVSGVCEIQYLQLCRFSYSVTYVMLVSPSGIEPSSPTLPGGAVVKHPPWSVGDEGSIPEWETNITFVTE